MSFKSWQSFWNFSKNVIHGNRYIHDEETIEFLNEILRTSKQRQQIIKKRHIYWRAQLGSPDEDIEEFNGEPHPYSKDRMYPLKYKATEGRANPKGIPYLYLATTKETAMIEVRPWVGSEISVAQFQTIRDLIIIDCSLNYMKNPLFFNENGSYEPDEKEREQAVWSNIDKAFSTPIIANENQANYVPTQVISELFRRNNFDGLSYKSSLCNGGLNIVLFDLNSADILNCFLYSPKEVSYEFQEIANPCFYKKSKSL